MSGTCKHGVFVQHTKDRGGYGQDCVLCMSEASRALQDRMAAMLRRLEWLPLGEPTDGLSAVKCAWCWKPQHIGHTPDCDLATLLRDLP